MSGPPAHIHVKPNAIPFAQHTPIPIPHHLRDQVQEDLNKKVDLGIYRRVAIGEPVQWCAPMVIVQKKNGSPQITINYTRLNAQCLRETHHCQSPFNLASQVPAGTWKSVVDAVDGYHSVALDEASKPLTAFITPWGRYESNRVPQGWIAAGDVYTRRYDEIIEPIPRKLKIVDDTLLYDSSIEEAFYHVWDYLSTCATNGIRLNVEKFQFCSRTVTFAGLNITDTGITPTEEMLNAIKKFPPPKDLTGARSWFGLIEQNAWAYSLSPFMKPFRDLLKPNAKITWDTSMQNIFETSKSKILEAIEHGVQSFDTSLPTCLQCDWSKDGVGYLLLQKHCQCQPEDNPNCCPEGWGLIFAGSRVTTSAESRYAPTEGEALAVHWALKHANMYVLGCPNLVIVTDHKPLLGILGDRDIGTIENPRLQRFKSKILRYTFKIRYCPGKWQRGADAISRYPAPTTNATIAMLRTEPSEADITSSNQNEEAIMGIVVNGLQDLHNNFYHPSQCEAITMEGLEKKCKDDVSYQTLITTIINGFPSSRHKLDPSIRNFWDTKDRLTTYGNIVLLDKRLVIPACLRTAILHTLHAAHQGCNSMKLRANRNVYWPSMNADILNFRAGCRSCTIHAPSNPKEPAILTPHPEWPFQQVCADFFEVDGNHYLAYVDRYSGWICIFYFKHCTSEALINTCRELFMNYGIPEQFCSDGGPQFSSHRFQEFLQLWGAKHRLS